MSIQSEYLHTDMTYAEYEARAYQDDMEFYCDEDDEDEDGDE